MEKTKAEAAAYAAEIELLTRARQTMIESSNDSPELFVAEEIAEVTRRLRVLLDIEEAK
jgi:hypothetical protein